MAEILSYDDPNSPLNTPKEKLNRLSVSLGKRKITGLFMFAFALLMLPVILIGVQTRQNIQQHASELYIRQTVNFNDFRGQDRPLNGEYPVGLINWGNDVWLVTPPWGLFKTKSVEFANRGVTSGKMRFTSPVRFVGFNAFNGGGRSTTALSVSCANNPTITIQVPAEKTASLTTGWTNLCQELTVSIANGWNTSLDDIIIDVPQGSAQITVPPVQVSPTKGITPQPTNPNNPTPTRSTVPTVRPTAVPTLRPTAIPTPRPTVVVPPPSTGGMWVPALNTSWQWQLSTPVNQNLNVQMYDIDGWENDASVVASLHAKGAKVVCYLSVGTYEDWRPDKGQFPNSVLGGSNGWPGEKWLDIRDINALAPIIRSRFDMCKQKGFDAIEPDNIDGYSNSTGFPLTAQDQINFNKFLAAEAHARGLSIALKNDTDQLSQLVPYFDWALNEECYDYNECGGYSSTFIAAGKAVFIAEYDLATKDFCPSANASNFNAALFDLDLTGKRTACR